MPPPGKPRKPKARRRTGGNGRTSHGETGASASNTPAFNRNAPVSLPSQTSSDGVPFPSKKLPGQYGFNSAIAKVMFQRGIYMGRKFPYPRGRLQTECGSPDGVGFAQHETAAWLVGPDTPINRLLVIHRTGSGKTNVMIKILEKYFSDPRPKVVIFPNSELVANFYGKFYKTKTVYSDFARYTAKRDNKAFTLDYFKGKMAMDGELHRRNRSPEDLAAPVRPIQYSIAGGSQVLGKTPKLSIFRAEYSGVNPYDNKIVLMDEVHNLVHPPPGSDRRLAKKLQRLRDALYSAKNCVIVGLTATPLVQGESDGDELIRMIKGAEYANTPTNEGFISYFNALPSSIYPVPLPGPEAIETVRVPMSPELFKKYQSKANESGITGSANGAPQKPLKSSAGPPGRPRPPNGNNRKEAKNRADKLLGLMNYCATSGYYTQAYRADFRNELKTKTAMVAPKLDVLVNDALKFKHKCAILIHRSVGFDALKYIIKSRPGGDKFAFMGKPKSKKEQEHNPILDEFNDKKTNGRGEKIKCLVLDAKFYGEGIDLIGVRKLFIAHPAPNYAAYKQWVGRVFRACAYTYLPKSERNVSVAMYISKIPPSLQSSPGEKTADEIMLQDLLDETRSMEQAIKKKFGEPASDRAALKHM